MKALVIIDVQEAFIGHRRNEQQYQDVFSTINAAAAQFRQAHCPVIVVRDLSEGSGEAFANVRELVVDPSDEEILKVYNNSFWKTELESILRRQSVDWLLLCGNAAEFCVSATYFGALERGFDTRLLRGGILAETEEGLACTQKVRPLLALNELPALFSE